MAHRHPDRDRVVNAGAAAIRRSVVRGTGHYLPERVVENDFFAQTLDTSDEWIAARTGIRQRYVAGEGETPVSLARRSFGTKTRMVTSAVLGVLSPTTLV